MKKVLISACLMGEKVRYDGNHCEVANEILARWHEEGRLLPICPEMAGGLPTPRPPAEIQGGNGIDVLKRRASVLTKEGINVTAPFIKGALATLELAQREGAVIAILKARSPSCGSDTIYDGSFTRTMIPGMGTAAAALSSAGIKVFDEFHIEEAAALLAQLE